MTNLRLESDSDTLDLDEQWGSDGYGYQAHAGAMGFGLPDAEVQWFEGAGDGAILRGRRVPSRDIDLPISIRMKTKAELIARYDRLTTALTRPCRLVRTDDDGYRWVLEVIHVGGGDYTTGVDTDGEGEINLTLQLRSGWSSWRRDEQESFALSPAPEGTEMPYGTVLVDNTGSADAWPVYTFMGPCTSFEVRNEDGEGFRFHNDLIDPSDVVVIDTGAGTVLRNGSNSYGGLDIAPRLFPLRPGVNRLTITMPGAATDTGGAVLIKASTTPRRINEHKDPLLSRTDTGTTEVRTNQCLRPDGSSTTSWQGRSTGSFTISSITSDLKPDFPGADGKWVRMHLDSRPASGANMLLLTPRAVHSGMATLSMWVKSKATVKTVYPVIRCANSSDPSDVSEPDRVGPPVEMPTNGSPVRISMEGHSLTGSNVFFGVRAEGALVGDWIDASKVLIEPVGELRTYFDGNVGEVLPGTTRSWSGTAGQSTSVMTGAKAWGWTGVGWATCWVHADRLYGLAAGDSGRLLGPTIPHTKGDPWVASVAAYATTPGAQAMLSVTPSTNLINAAASATYSLSTLAITIPANGGGTPPSEDVTQVRPMLHLRAPGVYIFYNLLVEKSSTLGPFFAGGSTSTINTGWYEWEGTANQSRSFEFTPGLQRASLTTFSYQPRRWAVI